MQQLFAIAVGGSLGAISRFLVANGIYAVLGRGFPYGTLFINVSGSFLMGFLTELMLQRFPLAVEYRAGMLIGFLGAYTTFSSFALETLYLFEEGGIYKAFLNVLLSVILCLAACWSGLLAGRMLFSESIYQWSPPHTAYLNTMFFLFGIFLLSSFMEYCIKYLHIAVEWRTIAFICLLGFFTIGLTLVVSNNTPGSGFDFYGILCIFIINALLSGMMIYAGTSLGNWLWQLKLSR